MRYFKAIAFSVISTLILYPGCNSIQQQNITQNDLKGDQTSTKPKPNQDFEVSKEVYNKTFQDIKSIIEELNLVIQKKDFKKWLLYLTKTYIIETNKSEYLKKWLEDSQLKKNNIVLNNLEDYFNYLVVPRRANAKLDLLEFLDESHLYAYTIINNEKYLLYYLVNTDKGWKIDFY